MKKSNLTAIVITKDKSSISELKNSLSFAKEIIIEEHKHISNFSEVRNKALKKAKYKWVLFVDDDEIVTEDLAKEIQEAIKDTRYAGYFVYRQDKFLGKVLQHGETSKVKLLRLANKSKGKFNRPVHEVWFVRGKTRTLKHPLLHNPHKSISSFLEKINKYSTMEAQYRNEYGVKSSLFHIIMFPFLKFIKNYIFYLGFLDGTQGTIMAIMMSFHSFQTWTKLYLLQHKNDK